MKNEIKAVQLDAKVIYMANGDVNVYPASHEQRRQVRNQRTNCKGRMVVEESGKASFRAFSAEGNPRYQHLFSVPYGEVKQTKERIIVQFSFPRRLSADVISELFVETARDIVSFLRYYDGGRSK